LNNKQVVMMFYSICSNTQSHGFWACEVARLVQSPLTSGRWLSKVL